MKKYYVSWLPAILIMVMIFFFSSKPADESARSSMPIADAVLKIYEITFGTDIQNETRDEWIMRADHIVRKTAHFLEYALLSAAIAFPLWIRKYRGIRLILLSVFAAALYAAADEFHQLFVPGRSGQIKDVLLDTAGAAFGAAVCHIAVFLAALRKAGVKKKVRV